MEQPGQEDSLINAFNKRFDRMALERNKEVISVATNGQDMHVLADYLMGDDACWVLVEFKSWANLGQYAEQRKPKSRKLCSELKKNNDARALHDRGHFAGYGVGIGMKFNIYRNHFCGGFDGDDNREQSDRAFLDAFYDRAVGLTPELADIYIRWLMDLDSDKTTTEIRRLKLLVDTGQDQVMIRSFASAAEASNWISDLQSWRSQPSPGSGSSTSPKP